MPQVIYIELLNELLTQLKETRSLVPGLLFNGISREQVDESIEGLNIRLPKEVYTLYEWKNGTALSSSLIPAESWLFPGGSFCSLEDAVDMYKHLAGNDEYWPPNLFMLLKKTAA